LRPAGNTQGGQQLARALGVNGLYACHAPGFEECFEPFVPECENHKLLSLGLHVGFLHDQQTGLAVDPKRHTYCLGVNLPRQSGTGGTCLVLHMFQLKPA
jgi:hypothetical protein